MATVKRRPRRRRDVLTFEQELELLIGPKAPDARAFRPGAPHWERSSFISPWERRQAWFRYRDQLLEDSPPGTRPWGWWQYEAPGAKEPLEADAEALVRLGVATPADEAEFRRTTEQLWQYYEDRLPLGLETDEFAKRWARRKALYRRLTGREAPPERQVQNEEAESDGDDA